MIAFKFDEQCKIEEEYEESHNGNIMGLPASHNISSNQHNISGGNLYGSIKDFVIKPSGTGGDDSCVEFNIDIDQDQTEQ